MRIMFVDVEEKGHHAIYLKSLTGYFKGNCLAIVPKENRELKCEQIVINDIDLKSKKITEYLKLVIAIRRISKERNIDAIHFLYGDIIYRFGGLGFKIIKKPIIVTFHLIREGYLYKARMRSIMKRINFGVTHAIELKEELKKYNISNVKYIDYPNFNENLYFHTNYARRKLGIQQDSKVIAALGGTRENKGLDILLEALKKVHGPFLLLIAGELQYFKSEFIDQETCSYKNSVMIIPRYLTDEEMSLCVASSDIIVLPYKKSFNGASGPLIEAVWNRKLVVGTDHGNIGRTINENRLGFTFESENSFELAKTLQETLELEYSWNETAEHYRRRLTVDKFCSSYKLIYEESVK